MYSGGIFLIIFITCQMLGSQSQDCVSRQEVQSILQHVHKLLSAHETSFLQSVRSLRKKLNLLQNNTIKRSSNVSAGKKSTPTCLPPNPLANGRMLGQVFRVGHQVHFLCNPGFQLSGPETRECLESLNWSGEEPTCDDCHPKGFHYNNCPLNQQIGSVPINNFTSCGLDCEGLSLWLLPYRTAVFADDVVSFMCALGWFAVECKAEGMRFSTFRLSEAYSGTFNNNTFSMPISTSSSSPTSTVSAHGHPSRCIEFQGSVHCTCEQGYSISSQDRGLCTDIDECELFSMTQSGRLCLHMCINTPGSYYCQCPTGYSIGKDNRSCQDIDECDGSTHNCTNEQVCVNTFGGYRCMVVECPHFRNASYVKTSPVRCERNPCVQGNKACYQSPVSINFHFMAVVSNMSTPSVLFRVSAARVLGDTLRFGLLGNLGAGRFALKRLNRQSGELLLVEPVQGPATLEAEVEMSELERRTLLGRYITKVTLFVAPYIF